MNLIVPIVIILAATGLSIVLALRGHVASPAIVFAIGIMAAAGWATERKTPLFSSTITITKTTASEAEKETP